MSKLTSLLLLLLAGPLAPAELSSSQDPCKAIYPMRIYQIALREYGMASYYARYFHKRRTASGARFDINGETCASLTWALGTRLEVQRLSEQGNVLSITCTVTDRGPYASDQGVPRILDLSEKQARLLQLKQPGKALVCVRPLPKLIKGRFL